jgi:hypothetical protein
VRMTGVGWNSMVAESGKAARAYAKLHWESPRWLHMVNVSALPTPHEQQHFIDAQPLILSLSPAVRYPQYLMPPIALLIDLQTAQKSYQLSQALIPRTRGQHDFRQPALPARHLPRKCRYATHNTLPLSRGQRREGTYGCEIKGRPCWQS